MSFYHKYSVLHFSLDHNICQLGMQNKEGFYLNARILDVINLDFIFGLPKVRRSDTMLGMVNKLTFCW